MIQCKVQPVWPADHNGYDEYGGEDPDDQQRYDRGCRAPGNIPHPVFSVFDFSDVFVSDVVPSDECQQQNACHRREKHDHCNDRAGVEVRQSAQHLIVKYGGYYMYSAAYGIWYAVISEAQREALHHRCGQGAG